MRPFLIKALNCAWLILSLIGLPAIARVHLAGLELSSSPTAFRLMSWCVGFGILANAGAAVYGLKNKKERTLAWEWALGWAFLLGFVLALSHGYLNFDWLKRLLMRVRNRF